MTVLAICRWIGLRTLRSPWTWALAALSALSWPLLETLAPISISSESGDLVALAYEFAFMGTLCGATLGLAAVGRVEPLLQRADAGTRTAVAGLCVAASGLLLALVAAAWPLLRGAVGEGGIAAGLLLAAAQVGALGAALSALPLSVAQRSLALWLLAWVVPAWVAPSNVPGHLACALFDVSATLRSPAEGWTPAALLARIGPMMGLYLAARLLAPPRGRRTARPT